MDGKMNVLDVQLDDYTAKEAMKAVTEYMKTEAVNTIEIVTVDILMRVAEDASLKNNLEQIDMVLAGDKAILEAAGITERKRLQEAQGQVFFKMLMRFFHKNRSKVFLLADKEEGIQELEEYLRETCGGVQIVGSASVPEDESADDMIMNRINGAETEADCVLAMLSSPKQEAFIGRCKAVLNARIWLGIGRGLEPVRRKAGWRERVADFVDKKILKREIQKEKKKKEI